MGYDFSLSLEQKRILGDLGRVLSDDCWDVGFDDFSIVGVTFEERRFAGRRKHVREVDVFVFVENPLVLSFGDIRLWGGEPLVVCRTDRFECDVLVGSSGWGFGVKEFGDSVYTMFDGRTHSALVAARVSGVLEDFFDVKCLGFLDNIEQYFGERSLGMVDFGLVEEKFFGEWFVVEPFEERLLLGVEGRGDWVWRVDVNWLRKGRGFEDVSVVNVVECGSETSVYGEDQFAVVGEGCVVSSVMAPPSVVGSFRLFKNGLFVDVEVGLFYGKDDAGRWVLNVDRPYVYDFVLGGDLSAVLSVFSGRKRAVSGIVGEGCVGELEVLCEEILGFEEGSVLGDDNVVLGILRPFLCRRDVQERLFALFFDGTDGR